MDAETRQVRQGRAQIRRAIESVANESGTDGVVTAFIVIAEISGRDEEHDAPCRTLWLDGGFHDDTGLVPWVVSGLLDSAYESFMGDKD